jgi:hypothetical protein
MHFVWAKPLFLPVITIQSTGFMKRIISLFAFALALVMSCSQTPDKSQGKSGAAISFETTSHDFGTLAEGGNGTFEFVFKNTGKDPLVLNNVRSTCGCTVPEWPREPVLKGDKGKIKVSYNTRITGSFSKSITVYSNAGDPIVLNIKGKVEAAK